MELLPVRLPALLKGISDSSAGKVSIDHNNIYYLFMAGEVYGGQVFGVLDFGTGPISITNNTMFALQTSGLNGNSWTIEIYPSSAATDSMHIDSNTITTAWLTTAHALGDPASGTVTGGGIYVNSNGGTITGTISKNTIRGLGNYFGYMNSSYYGIEKGIEILGTNSNWTVSNNQITMQDSTFEAALIGIDNELSSSSVLRAYYNSVLVQGSPSTSSGSLNSYAYYRLPAGTGTVTGDVDSLQNNIFMNARTGGGGSHYAIANVGTSNYATNFNVSNYNLLASSNTSNVGYWGNTAKSFAAWQTASSRDANSQNAQTTTTTGSATLVDPAELFTYPNYAVLDINITPVNAPWPYSLVYQEGKAVTNVLTDIHGTSRSAGTAPTGPDIGVDEFIACVSPVVTASPASQSVCSGTNVSFGVTATGTVPTYQWQENQGSGFANISNGGIYSNATTDTLTLTGVTSGMNSYQYRCVVSGCSTSATSGSATLTVTATPTITGTTPGSNCGTGAVTLGATASVGTVYWYGASTGGSSLSSGTSYTTPSISTTTTYYAGATNGSCSSTSRTGVTATINDIPSASASNTGPYCYTGNISLSSLPSGMGTYAWSGPGSYTSSSQNPTEFAAGGNGGTYAVTVTSSAGCSATASTSVTVNPAVSVTVTLSGCSFVDSLNLLTGVDSNMIQIVAVGGTSPYTFTAVSASDVQRVNLSTTQRIFTAPANNTSHTFGITDAAGCTASASVSTLNNNPTDIPYTAAVTDSETASCYSAAFNKWVTFQDPSNLAIVAINDNGQNLGNLAVTVFKEDTTPLVNATTTSCPGFKQPALSRHFLISSTASQPFSNPVQVRLFFGNNELDSLISRSNANDVTGVACTLSDNVNTINDLYVTKYDDSNPGHATENGIYSDNLPVVAGGIYKVFGTNGAAGPLLKKSNGFSTYYAGSQNEHYVQLGVHEFSELWLNGSEGGAALPVSMLYLEAEAVNNTYIQVRWATASEINNAFFAVERSIDGVTWDSIGLVQGHDNSTVENDYTYDDMNVVPDVRYYYRLKQVDFNNNATLTDIVTAMINSSPVFNVLGFMPNPAASQTSLLVKTSTFREITVEFYDMLGQKVISENHQLIAGSNKIDFALNKLASGIYNARVTSEKDVYNQQIVVTK